MQGTMELVSARPSNNVHLGSGVGANHQTGWTGLVAKLLQQSGDRVVPVRAEKAELEGVLSGD